VGKPRSRWDDTVWREALVAPDTGQEGGSREDRRLEEGDRRGHSPIIGRNTTRG
jgi:hypothetical protein